MPMRCSHYRRVKPLPSITTCFCGGFVVFPYSSAARLPPYRVSGRRSVYRVAAHRGKSIRVKRLAKPIWQAILGRRRKQDFDRRDDFVGRIRRYAASGGYAPMPDATLARLIISYKSATILRAAFPIFHSPSGALSTFPFLLTVEKKESLCLNIVVFTSKGNMVFTVNLRNRRNQLLTTSSRCSVTPLLTTSETDLLKLTRRSFCRSICIVSGHYLKGDDDFSSRWREIKKQFTHACGLKNIWQPRFGGMPSAIPKIIAIMLIIFIFI